jgi:hypothetical protein
MAARIARNALTWKQVNTLSIVLLGLLALAGCSAATGAPRASGSVITRQELEPLQSFTAYDAIARLRPNWLQTRGPTSLATGPTLPRVHINQSPAGSFDELRSMSTVEVESMEFMSPADATTLYGTGYPGGLILVRTRR